MGKRRKQRRRGAATVTVPPGVYRDARLYVGTDGKAKMEFSLPVVLTPELLRCSECRKPMKDEDWCAGSLCHGCGCEAVSIPGRRVR